MRTTCIWMAYQGFLIGQMSTALPLVNTPDPNGWKKKKKIKKRIFKIDENKPGKLSSSQE